MSNGVGQRINSLAKELKWGGYDFAYWFDKPRATVRNWYLKEYEPRGYIAEEIHASLDLLETAFKKGWTKQLTGISAHDRPNTIKHIRKCAESGRVPEPYSSNRRVEMRRSRKAG